MKKLLSLLSTITMAGSGISGIVANSPYEKQEQQTKLENINYKRQKRNNNENNKINRTKIVIKTGGHIFSSGVVFNSKLYFGSWDGNVYEYDPATGQQKIVIKANSIVFSSGVVFNNKLYFGSHDHNVYEYDPATGQQKILITLKDEVLSSGVVLNNKLYFGSGDHNVYEYDPVIGQQKIVIKANNVIHSSGVVFNNKLYIGSHDHNVYEYDPATGQQMVIITTKGEIFASGIILNNKLYFGSKDHNVYEYDPATGQQKTVIKTEEGIWSSGVVFNNKLYFGSIDHKVYEYNPATGQQKVVITTNGEIKSSGIVFNNKLYIGSGDHNVYEYSATGQQKIVIRTNNWVDSSGVVFNNKLYIGSGDGNVYEYSNYYNLGQINNDSDNTILNELNYLNPDLDISLLEIVNKTNNSAIIKEKNNSNNKYFGEVIVNYKIKNKDEINDINLNELIKRAVFFKFRDENPNLIFKEISNVNSNNLNFSNTEITKQENSFLWSNVPKNVCSDREIINKTPNTRSFNVPACEYNSKSKLVFQITTGLTKTKQENKLNGWNINSDDEMKLTDFTNINNKNSEIINVLSNEFDLSNTNKQEQEMILSIFKEPADKFELNPNEKLKITYPVRIIISKVILNLKQKITGNITAKIIDDNNKEQIITLSITKVMQILQKYSLLPNEITIDKNNDKITFNGGAFFSSEREGPVRTNTVTTIV
ncbi:PQQ-binding-like beta-propeller repeat protein [Spiroplasma endosymbiont of Clivina fossor]|uniref:outer membrane protein assembly factor BamB family protein n=1 Tax=Spiroplasma endosymbiont of Clivina fossor TaxID=3066282 RepID=UPI00313C8D6B